MTNEKIRSLGMPMYLAAIGPKNLELAGELFDGWLAIFYRQAGVDQQDALLRPSHQ